MKAMRYRGYGSPDQIEQADVLVPRPGPSQLLVRIAASSVNPVDWKLHNGQYRWLTPARFPSIPGSDVAGEVIETGTQVTRFKPGDRIFAMLDARAGGASAEYAVVSEHAAARMPAKLSAREAAVLPLAGLTALQMLRDFGNVSAGKHVLIVGASGGVGHLAVQIAKSHEAEVTAVCSRPHVNVLLSLGADRVTDYTKQADFRGPYDLVLDLAVRAPVRTFFPVMSPDGIYVSSLPSAGRIAAALLLPVFSRRRVRIVTVKPHGEDLEALRELCEAGKLKPVIGRVFKLEELAAAHALSQKGGIAGKIAIDVLKQP